MAGKSPMQKLADEGKTPLAFQPERGQGSSITLQQLEERYGKKQGREVYFRVALAGGFGDLRNMSYVTLPPLDTAGLKSAQREAVESVLAGADKEFKVAEPASAEE